jgi:hypothetical protein
MIPARSTRRASKLLNKGCFRQTDQAAGFRRPFSFEINELLTQPHRLG